MPELGGREIVVFNRIPRTKGFKISKTRNITKSFVLNFFWQGGTKTVDINFNGIPSFRLNEQLMSFLFSEAVKFVFNTGAISGPYSINPSGKHRAPVESGFQNLMDYWVCIGYPAASLFGRKRDIQIGKSNRALIPFLFFHFAIIQASSIYPGRSACF